MHVTRHTLFAALILPLVGFGCIGTKPPVVIDSGGVWLTGDAGETWIQKSTWPTAAGTSTISSADIKGFVFDPSDLDAIYLMTKADGLFYSYDNGNSWIRPEEPALQAGIIGGVAIDPTDKCNVYVAKGANVMKSTDCNRTYEKELFVESTGSSILSISIDWFNSNVIWIGTAAGDVYKSADSGATWTREAHAPGPVTQIQIDNADSRIVLVMTSTKAITRTDNGGETWLRQEEIFEDFAGAELGSMLTQTKDGNNTYYLSKWGVFKSTDHGATWTPIKLLTPTNVKVYSFAVNPDDANILYYGTLNAFYVTTNAGAEWATHELPTTRAATALTVDPNNTTAVFMGVSEIDEEE